MGSISFIIPVKLDTLHQEFYLQRCIESIRRFYKEERIIIVKAPGTHISLTLDSKTTIEVNPYFSTLGALYLYYQHRYSDVACILHDSMVLLQPLPTIQYDIQFLYHFEKSLFEHTLNIHGYKRILPNEYQQLLNTLQVGCFGNACILRHPIIEKLGILPIIPQIQTKYDFECMERIFAYLVQKNGFLVPSLCGNIMNPITDPWKHKEYSSMTLNELLTISFPYSVLKSAVSRK